MAAAAPHTGALPSHVLHHILPTATTHDDLLAHVALCARVHPEWRRAVMGSAAYGRGIVGNSTAQRPQQVEDALPFKVPTLGDIVNSAELLGRLQITESLDLQVESAVAGDQLEHVVKESDTCGDAVTALSFETDSYGDFCFGGMPFDECASHACNAC